MGSPVPPPVGPAEQPGSRKEWTMNRHMVGTALVLLLAGVESVNGQTAARVEYRDGRIGVAVAIGDLPVRVVHPRTVAGGWVAANPGPVRVVVNAGRPHWGREILRRNDLRHLLGNDMVRMLERHGRAIGLRGPIQGQWFRLDRRTVLLEVTVRGAPVAELYDYGVNGRFERVYLAQAPVHYRYR
jgi:hypothetical protein